MRPTSSLSWLWAAYAVSTYGTWLAFGAFPLLAVRVLHSAPLAVSLLDASGLAGAALLAVPIGPWIDRHRKRTLMIGMDLIRFVATGSVPIAYLLGLLSYGQLLVVSLVVATSNIAFTSASGAYLKHHVDKDRLLVANGRFEGTSWLATAAGPPIGGVLIETLGPVITIAGNTLSYLLSAVALLGISERKGTPSPEGARPLNASDLLQGWRIIFGDQVLRRLFLNAVAVNGLIMATGPLLAVLLLGQYNLPAWQYGLAFGVPAVGGFVGARLCPRLVARHGRIRTVTITGWLRSIFPIGLAFTHPGLTGLLTVITVEGLLITSMGIFNPIAATERLLRTPAEHAAQVLTTWSISSKLAQAGAMASWGLLATLTTPLVAITIAGVLLLGTPLLLPNRQTLR